MRPLAVGLLAALSACAPEIDLTAEAALEAAYVAAEEGDARLAMRLIDHAAETGDFDALAVRDEVYRRGYVQVPRGYIPGETQRNVAIPAYVWHQHEARDDLEAALEDGARAGDPDALILIAERQMWPAIGYRDEPADLDSARAIYRTLEEAGVDPMRLFVLAHNVGDEAGALRHLEAAARTGDPKACHLRYFRGKDRRIVTAADVSDAVDYHEGCRTRALEAAHPIEGVMTDDLLENLMTQVRAGNDLAIAHRDSLLALGVADRHPRLRAVLEDERDA